MNLVRVFPMSVLSRRNANETLAHELDRMIRLCRSITSLDAP